jgi:serine/threonine protein kinase
MIVCLVFLVLYLRYRRMQYLDSHRPYAFQEQIRLLQGKGLLPSGFKSHIPREVNRVHVKLLDMIGKGAFGNVFKGLIDESQISGVPQYSVAIKVLLDDPTRAELDEFMREAAIMAQFNHPNVLSQVGVVTVDQPYMILLQLCEHGSLLSFLKSRSSFWGAKMHMILDVAKGMAYLAGLNVVHRDLAARNVLVGTDYICKVCVCVLFWLVVD